MTTTQQRTPDPVGSAGIGSDGRVAAPIGTGSKGTRILGAIAAALTGLLLLFGLVLSPADQTQMDLVRLFYIHVPSAIAAYVVFFGTALGSGMYLWKKSQWWDVFAAACAEVGVVMGLLAIGTGMIWGKPTWGAYWVWDARLTTTALLVVLFVGYLAVRQTSPDIRVASKRAAIVGLIAFLDVPVVHYSVDWWRGLHQEPTITRADPQIDGLMLFSVFLGMVTFTAIIAWLLVHRFRLAYMEQQLLTGGIDVALEERRAEAEGDATTTSAGTQGVKR